MDVINFDYLYKQKQVNKGITGECFGYFESPHAKPKSRTHVSIDYKQTTTIHVTWWTLNTQKVTSSWNIKMMYDIMIHNTNHDLCSICMLDLDFGPWFQIPMHNAFSQITAQRTASPPLRFQFPKTLGHESTLNPMDVLWGEKFRKLLQGAPTVVAPGLALSTPPESLHWRCLPSWSNRRLKGCEMLSPIHFCNTAGAYMTCREAGKSYHYTRTGWYSCYQLRRERCVQIFSHSRQAKCHQGEYAGLNKEQGFGMFQMCSVLRNHALLCLQRPPQQWSSDVGIMQPNVHHRTGKSKSVTRKHKRWNRKAQFIQEAWYLGQNMYI